MRRILPILLLLVVGCGEAFAQGQVTRPGKQTTAPAKPKPQAKPSKPKPEKASQSSRPSPQQDVEPAKPTAFSGVMSINGINYRLKGYSLTCDVIKGDYTGEVVIPATVSYNGEEYTVTKIASEAFKDCKKLTSISIPSTITEVEIKAFDECWGLKKVEYASIESLCRIKFDYSNPLKYTHTLYINGQEVTQPVIPDGVTSIGKFAFDGCQNITTVHIPNSVTSIGEYAFNGCRKLSSVKLPDSLTKIEGFTFSYCMGLTSVVIPNSVIEIGSEAFMECEALKSLTLPNSVRVIGHGVFQHCYGLTSLTIPNSVTNIKPWAFAYCKNLKDLRFEAGDSEISIVPDAFKGTPVENEIKGLVQGKRRLKE